jgi:predicted NAD-dependent protein-ADP-ribosyltransferase YbiA (DUF1768 family)
MPIKFYTPEFYVFNNFSAHAIEFRGKLYPTCEHAYQATKCTDPEGQEAIRQARSPRADGSGQNVLGKLWMKLRAEQ